MENRPRSDIYINLPALSKLDAMLIVRPAGRKQRTFLLEIVLQIINRDFIQQEILDSFQDTEFWYAEQGSMSSNSTRSGSFRRVIVQRKDEKWWVPVPCVPAGGLSDKSRKHLRHKRDCATQIHKAAMAINSSVLAEMEIPDAYVSSLPRVSIPCKSKKKKKLLHTVIVPGSSFSEIRILAPFFLNRFIYM